MSGLGCLGIDRHVDSRLDWQRSPAKKVDNYSLRLRGSPSRLYDYTFGLRRELLPLDAIVFAAVVLFLFSSLASRRFGLFFVCYDELFFSIWISFVSDAGEMARLR